MFLLLYTILTLLICSFGTDLFSFKIQAAVLPSGFVIDTEHVYPNMDTAYKDGYNPKISGGKAMIVMPLVHDGYDVITGDQITATVQYGNVAETPFVVKQYQKQVKQEVYTLSDGQVKSVYLVEFDLDLKGNRMNGTYPVNIDIQYTSLDINDEGNSTYTNKEQVFPAYVVIQDGIDPNGGTSNPHSDVNLNLESCEVNPQVIHPGDEFSITAGFKNASAAKAIKNIKISYDNAEGALIPANNMGTKRIDKLEAGYSDTVDINMKAAKTITNYQQKLVLNIEYQDADGNSYTEVENIYISLQPPEDNNTPVTNALEIETKHTFQGMDNSYEKGYVPSVDKGKATIVMPLDFKGTGQIKGKEITSIVGFDATANQAFQIKSYQKNFKQYQYTAKNGDKVPIYLVNFTLDLKKDRINGVYPVNITVQYELGTEVKQQVFTAYVVIEDGKDPNEGQTEEEPVQFTPKIIVDNCITEPADCNPKDEVTFKVTLKNTNKDKTVKDIKMTYLSETGDLTPVDNKNSIYLDSLGAGKSKDVSFKMKVASEVTTPNQIINLTIEGVDEVAAAVSSTDSLFIHVNQPFGIKIDNPVLKNEMKSGKTEKIKIPIYNTGKTNIKNIMCVLDMQGVIPSGTAYIGEIEPSATEEATISVVVANKKVTDKTVAEEDKYGLAKGTVTVNYEDSEGKTYTEVLDVQTKIVAPANETQDAAVISSQWWISFIVGLVVIQLIIYAILFYRKKRRI